MKICFVTANYPPEAIGGTEQVVTALARAFVADGHEVVVLSGSDLPHDGPCSQIDRYEGVHVERFFKKPDEHDRHGDHASAMARKARSFGRPGNSKRSFAASCKARSPGAKTSA